VTDPRAARHAEMLRNRLVKNARHLRRWARREQVSCYRVYDRDIPEVPLVIDWYDGHLVVAARLREDERERAGWLEALVAVAAAALEVPAAQVHLRRRERLRGGEARHQAARGRSLIVVEAGLRYQVDLDGHLDTGLFLDHRPLRRRIAAEAGGRRFLNLFCYTGAFTVCAAAGGAASSASVDLSHTYLERARANLELNRLDHAEHRLHQADVLRFLDEPPYPPRSFDLAVLDPPTFSSSKRMDDVLDVQRDHRWLLERTLALLSPGGELYFSTNRRHFRLDADRLPVATIDDITEQTIPPDFRDRRVHRCWRLVR